MEIFGVDNIGLLKLIITHNLGANFLNTVSSRIIFVHNYHSHRHVRKGMFRVFKHLPPSKCLGFLWLPIITNTSWCSQYGFISVMFIFYYTLLIHIGILTL